MPTPTDIQRRILPAPLFAGILACSTLSSTPSQTPALDIPDIGQGHALLWSGNEGAVLLDAGPDSSGELKRLLNRRNVDTLEAVVISHWDLDHAGGLDSVFSRCGVRRILQGSEPADAWLSARHAGWCAQASGGCVTVAAGEVLDLAGLELEILAIAPLADDDNARSLVSRWRRRSDGRALLVSSGDLDTVGEARILAGGLRDLRADVLQLGHHGSRTSGSLPWVGAVAPRVALIQAGRNNPWGHPHPEPLAHAQAVGAVVFSTARDGAARIVWDPDPILAAP